MLRWHTLADCCASIGKILPTLKLNGRTRQVFAREGLGSDSGCQVGVNVSLCRSFCWLGRQVAEVEDWLRVSSFSLRLKQVTGVDIQDEVNCGLVALHTQDGMLRHH